jgi:hypothetical protein
MPPDDRDLDVFVDSELRVNVCCELKDFSYHDILLNVSMPQLSVIVNLLRNLVRNHYFVCCFS